MAQEYGKEIVTEFKEELLNAKTPAHARAAFLSGAIRGAGSLTLDNSGVGLSIAHTSREFIDKCAALAEEALRLPTSLTMRYSINSLRTEALYELKFLPQYTAPLLEKAGVMAERRLSDRLPPSYFENPHEKQAFLRSLFLAAGGLTLPNVEENETEGKRSGYAGYLAEIKLSEGGVAQDTRELLRSYGIPAKIRERKNGYTVYLQGQESLTDFMTALGATNVMFRLCNFVAERSLNNNVNRRTNCQMANLEKIMGAGEEQLNAIQVLSEKGILQKLDDKLQSAAALRAAHPTASLSELTSISNPPVSKSGLNHRLAKLTELAKQYREENHAE